MQRPENAAGSLAVNNRAEGEQQLSVVPQLLLRVLHKLGAAVVALMLVSVVPVLLSGCLPAHTTMAVVARCETGRPADQPTNRIEWANNKQTEIRSLSLSLSLLRQQQVGCPCLGESGSSSSIPAQFSRLVGAPTRPRQVPTLHYHYSHYLCRYLCNPCCYPRLSETRVS